jgi:hypothetical protein
MATEQERPPVLASPALDAWLDDPASVGLWPVPAPFDVRGGKVIAAGAGGPAAFTFALPDQPWLATDFAHVATALQTRAEAEDAPLRVAEAALRFADEYGLPGPWPWRDPVDGPPAVMPLQKMLENAWDLRQALAEYRDLSGPTVRRGPIRDKIIDQVINGGGPLGVFLGEAQAVLRFRIEPFPDGPRDPLRLRAGFWWEPRWGLLDLMRLQLLADFLARRPISSCDVCGRLFIWSKGRSGAPRRSDGMRGRRPRFCSYAHAQESVRKPKQPKS